MVEKIKSILKNKFYLTLIIIFIVLMITNAVLDRLNDETNNNIINTTPPQNQVDYNNVHPGYDDRNSIIKKLGEPLNNRNTRILEFRSSAPGKPHFVELDDNTVSIIRETIDKVDNIEIDDITSKHGEPEHILYDSRSLGGFYLFVYPQKGLAYVGHPESGILLEIWYFKPMNYEAFKKRHARGYKEDAMDVKH
jgi:hypothetical protein